MPFVRFDDLEKEYVTPQHSAAYGESVTGRAVEVGRLTFKKGEGAEEHSHPQEQVIYIMSGRVTAELAGETRDSAQATPAMHCRVSRTESLRSRTPWC